MFKKEVKTRCRCGIFRGSLAFFCFRFLLIFWWLSIVCAWWQGVLHGVFEEIYHIFIAHWRNWWLIHFTIKSPSVKVPVILWAFKKFFICSVKGEKPNSRIFPSSKVTFQKKVKVPSDDMRGYIILRVCVGSNASLCVRRLVRRIISCCAVVSPL